MIRALEKTDYFLCRGFVSVLILVGATLCGCSTEYVGYARMPTLPLPPGPVEEKVQAVRTERGIELTIEEWSKVLRNTERLRADSAGIRQIVEVYNRFAQEARPVEPREELPR